LRMKEMARERRASGPPRGVATVATVSSPSSASSREDGTTRLVVVRHGESACSVAGVVGGTKGCTGLSPEGRRQAELLRERLKRTGELSAAAAIYASDLPRALETAWVIQPSVGGGSLEVLVDPDLRELEPGEADGLTWAEYESLYEPPDFDTDPNRPVAPGGESWSGFVERATRSLERVAQAHSGECVVVVCHAGLVEASMLRFMPACPKVPRLRLPTANTSLTEWLITNGRFVLSRYNDAAHLAGGRNS